VARGSYSSTHSSNPKKATRCRSGTQQAHERLLADSVHKLTAVCLCSSVTGARAPSTLPLTTAACLPPGLPPGVQGV
jgi:hypothetical protein